MTTSGNAIQNGRKVSRRAVFRGAGVAGVALASVGVFGRPLSYAIAGNATKVKLAWAEVAACHSPVAFAVNNGLFAKHNVDVELSYHGLSGQVIIQAIATGKVDLGAHLLLDWLKPLEQGFDVKLVTGTHGGCQRILVSQSAGIASLEDLRGKTIAVADLAGVSKAAFVVTLAKAGFDPEHDVNWQVFPGELLAEAVKDGRADALATLDPDAYRFKKENDFLEIANTQTGVYQDRVCCAVAARGDFLTSNRDAVRRTVDGIIEVHEYTASHPEEVAAFYLDTYKPAISLEDLTTILSALTYHHHPVGPALTKEVIASLDDLKLVKVIDADTDTAALAAQISHDILA